MVDPSLHWTEHFVRYGYALRRGLADPAFCDQALAEVKRVVGLDTPFDQWTADNAPTLHQPFRDGDVNAVFEKVYDQPGVQESIQTMFAGGEPWNGVRNYYLFVKPFDPKAERTICQHGHIDFGNQPVPILFRGFNMQVALRRTEPFSGNLTVHPGSHAVVQKQLIDDPDWQAASGVDKSLDIAPPWEFVAEPGDVVFHSHLCVHSGNANAAAGRSPRIALHCDIYRNTWLRSVDPADASMGPWERSLAQNGAYALDFDEEARHVAFRRQQGDKQYM